MDCLSLILLVSHQTSECWLPASWLIPFPPPPTPPRSKPCPGQEPTCPCNSPTTPEAGPAAPWYGLQEARPVSRSQTTSLRKNSPFKSRTPKQIGPCCPSPAPMTIG